MADIFGTNVDETLIGTADDDLIVGYLGNDVLEGGSGDDQLAGNEGDDAIDGGDGDDEIWAGAGQDTITGGAGTDVAYFHSDGLNVDATQGVVVDLGQGTATDGWGFDDTISGIEHVVGTSFADTLIGDALGNQLVGLAGGDILSGNGGDDFLVGGAGDDTLHGNAGDDELSGGEGNDLLVGEEGDDFFPSAFGNDTINGGSGFDTISFLANDAGTQADHGVTINLQAGTATDGWGYSDTIVSVEKIYGTNFADSFTGTSESNSFFGGGGDDIITGGVASSSASGDWLAGGGGNDTIQINNGFALGEVGNDRILGQGTSSQFAFAGVSFWGATNGIVANLTATARGGLAGGDATGGYKVSDGLGGVDLISDLHVIYGSNSDDTFYVDSTWTVGGDNSIQIRTGEGDDSVNFFGVEHASLSYWESEGGVRADLGLGTATDAVAGDSHVGNDTFSGVDYFYGSTFADTINGSSGADKALHGEAGNDTIRGLAGDDNLFGGDGNDTLDGGAGVDWLEGQAGTDTLRGGAGDDFYVVDNANDTIDESVSGSTGADEVQSYVNFSLVNSARVLGNFERLYLEGTANISGTGNSLNNVIGGNSGANTIAGNAGNDELFGNGGNDTLSGGAGNDWLVGGAGNDTMRGGAGNDVYVVNSSSDTIDENASGSSGTDEVQSSISFSLNTSGRVLGDFEELFLTGTGDINATGNALNNAIGGNDGVNTLTGNAGNDELSGNSGNDTLIGGAGNDILHGGAGNDTMKGGAGNDVYIVNSSSDTIDEKASGSSGADEVQSSISFNLNASTHVLGNFERLYLEGTANISGTGNSLNNVIGGNSGANTIAGNAGNDELFGNGGNDTLSGGVGNDWLVGGAGNDTMRGGAGNDVYVVNSSSDTIDEKASGSSGTDEVQSSISFSLNTSGRVLGDFEELFLTGTGDINATGNALNNAIGGNDGVNTLTGNAGNDELSGNNGNDTLIGGADNDILHGGAGFDTMKGGAGNDDYVVDNTNDIVNEGVSGSAGLDTVHTSISFNLNNSTTLLGSVERIVLTGSGNINGTGNALGNAITGNSGANNLAGNVGNDSLYGNDGNDRITGGAGNDTLLGGGGADTFVFNAALSNEMNVDHIIDFVSKDDVFWLDNAVMTALGATGSLGTEKYWKSASGTAHDANDRIVYDTDDGKLYYDSNGSASGGSSLIATLNPNIGITASDFVVI